MSANREDFVKKLGAGIGITIGLLTPLTTHILATTSIATLTPVILGGLAGILLFTYPTELLHRKINRRFDLHQTPMKNLCFHFLLVAASTTLSILVGLMITSAFVTTIANPFTLPALIAGGISVSIMLALYAWTYPERLQVAQSQLNTAPHGTSVHGYDEESEEGDEDAPSLNDLCL